MTTLQATRLKTILDRAKNTGVCEESATIAGLPITVRSLPPEAYNEIYRELEDYEEGPEYMHAHLIEHIARAICEIDGEDLREVQFVTVEVEDPQTKELKEVNVPCHEWLKDNIISTWSRETVHTVHRKFLDACNQAEENAREGVEFKVEGETDEEKFRRLLGEAIFAGDQLPDEIRDAILKEHDLLPATSKEELEKANEAAKQFLAEQREKMGLDSEGGTGPKTVPAPPPDPPSEPIAAPDPPDPPEPAAVPQQLIDAAEEPQEPQPSPEELMAARTPLNREAVQERTPPNPENNVQVVNQRPPPPSPDLAVTDLSRKGAERAAQYAALEAAAAAEGLDPGSADPNTAYRIHQSDAVLEKPVNSKVDKGGLKLNQKPTGGVNKKFVSPINNPGMGGLDPRARRGR